MYFSLIILLVSIVNLNLCNNSNPGHLKPFGTVGSLINIEEINKEYPDALKFFTSYVSKSEPFISRQVLNNDMYFNVWQSNEKLESKIDGLSKTNIVVESIKQRKRIQMKFGEFLDLCDKENLFFADNVPEILRTYLVLPRPLHCDEALSTIQSATLIINSINTSPLMFNEDYDIFLCLFRGNKRVALVNTNQHPEVRSIFTSNNQNKRRPMVNPEQVDFNQHPELANVDYYVANLTAGDCLFVPNEWVFQERSLDNIISVLYNMRHAKTAAIDLNELENCVKSDTSDSSFTLDLIDWAAIESEPQNLREVIMSLINSKSNTFDKWKQTFSKYFSYDLSSDPETSAIFDDFYNIIDMDGDGQVTTAEMDQINGAHQHHISDILYEMINLVNEKQKNKGTNTEEIVEDIEEVNSTENDEDLPSQDYKTDL